MPFVLLLLPLLLYVRVIIGKRRMHPSRSGFVRACGRLRDFKTPRRLRVPPPPPCGCTALHTAAVLSLAAQGKAAGNHYQVLGVERDATSEEIRAAFVTLSKKYHPDRNLDGKYANSRAFVEVTEAYRTLISPKRRERYNSELRVAENYRTQYEQRFYRGSPSSNEQPFADSQKTDNYSSYSTGGGHARQFYTQYDDSEVDWEMYKAAVTRPKHARVVYMLLFLVVTVPALFILRIVYNYNKYYKRVAIEESQRNMAAYFAVREKARNSSVQDQLDLLVKRHAETMKTARDIDRGPPDS